jgi:phosphate transport system permease protein
MTGMVNTPATVAQVERAIAGNRRDLAGKLFQAILVLALVISLGLLLLLLGSAASKGVPELMDRGASFFTDGNSTIASRAGISQALSGSLILMAIVGVVALPIGIGAAIYIEEYARDTRVTRFINANIRNLAGVPSIVYGLLGLAIFVDTLRKVLTGLRSTGSLVSGGLTLSVLVLPIVIITTAEALRAVPKGIREAAYGVGATRWEVIRSHVLPYAAPGVLTGTVLTLARAFGETAPLILVGGVQGFFSTGNAGLGGKVFGNQAYTALPLLIFDWSKRVQPEFKSLAAAAIVVMMVALLLVNGVAIVMRNRYERKW